MLLKCIKKEVNKTKCWNKLSGGQAQSAGCDGTHSLNTVARGAMACQQNIKEMLR